MLELHWIRFMLSILRIVSLINSSVEGIGREI